MSKMQKKIEKAWEDLKSGKSDGVVILIPDRRKRVHQVCSGKISAPRVLSQFSSKAAAERECVLLAQYENALGWGRFFIISPLAKDKDASIPMNKSRLG